MRRRQQRDKDVSYEDRARIVRTEVEVRPPMIRIGRQYYTVEEAVGVRDNLNRILKVFGS